MATSKQIGANRVNGKNGGVKTDVGKTIVRWNALKHGLLAREVIIDAGDGRENREEFDSFFGELQQQLRPQGLLEGILVENMAVSYWRYRRVLRHEVGLLRAKLDGFEKNYYDPLRYRPGNEPKNHRRILEELDDLKEQVNFFQDANDKEGHHVNPKKAEEEDWIVDLEDYYKALVNSSQISWQDNFITADYKYDVHAIYSWLMANGWSAQKIKTEFVKIGRERVREKETELNQAKAEDQTRLTQSAKEKGLPHADGADTIIRYESAILRQFYRAMHELERLQGARNGLAVPPPLTVDIENSPVES